MFDNLVACGKLTLDVYDVMAQNQSPNGEVNGIFTAGTTQLCSVAQKHIHRIVKAEKWKYPF